MLGALAAGTVAILAACSMGDGGSSEAERRPLPSASPPAGVPDPATSPQLADFYSQRVSWKGCGDGYECTRIQVPLDWGAPGGRRLSLALNRLPASGDRLGSLLVNPGGPGVSGLDYARAARSQFGEAVLSAYDVVGFDPRGVGASDPVTCLPEAQVAGFLAEDATPDDAAEVRDAVSRARAYGKECAQRNGPLLGHVDTLSTVRDLDVIRAVIGQQVLTYYGGSYGTFLGAWYAQTFPWRVGRMVLDSAVDPNLTTLQYAQGQAEGFSRVLRLYMRDCLSRRGCPLRGTEQQAIAQLDGLVAAADGAPLRTDSGRPLTQSLMTTGIAQALYARQLWNRLTVGLTEATQGNGTALLALADFYFQRDQQGRYGQAVFATGAIYCLDAPETRTVEQIRADAEQLGRRYPPLGAFIGWGALGCREWPVSPVLKPTRLTAAGAAPILVVGTVNDPATPYEWAQSLASQLSSGRLLTWEGAQHGAYPVAGPCINDAVEGYLIGGTLPPDGKRCPA